MQIVNMDRYFANLELESVRRRNRVIATLAYFGAGLALAGILILTSCGTTPTTNPLLTPAAVTGDVSDTVSLGLLLYPPAAGEVAAARDVICADAGQTNVSVAQVIQDLNKAGLTNQTAKIIVNGVLLVWNRVTPFLNTTNTQEYANAVCLGLQQATATGGAARKAQRRLPPHIQ
jgi:hypothetical protein